MRAVRFPAMPQDMESPFASRLWRARFVVLWRIDEALHAVGMTCVPLCRLVGRMEPRYYESSRP